MSKALVEEKLAATIYIMQFNAFLNYFKNSNIPDNDGVYPPFFFSESIIQVVQSVDSFVNLKNIEEHYFFKKFKYTNYLSYEPGEKAYIYGLINRLQGNNREALNFFNQALNNQYATEEIQYIIN